MNRFVFNSPPVGIDSMLREIVDFVMVGGWEEFVEYVDVALRSVAELLSDAAAGTVSTVWMSGLDENLVNEELELLSVG